MELTLRNGDYVPDGAAGLQRVYGQEALLQRVLFRLSARRGGFPFQEELGSQLWKLGQLTGAARQAAARQYVVEALAQETGLTVENVALAQNDGQAFLTAELSYQGETLTVTLDVRV